MLDICSFEWGDVYFSWRKEFSQDSDVGIDWRKALEDALPDEGNELQDVAYNYLIVPEVKSPRDMTNGGVTANWEDVKAAKVQEIKGLFTTWVGPSGIQGQSPTASSMLDGSSHAK